MLGLLLMLQGSPGTTDEKAKGGRALGGGSNFEALAASKSKSTVTSDGSLAPVPVLCQHTCCGPGSCPSNDPPSRGLARVGSLSWRVKFYQKSTTPRPAL